MKKIFKNNKALSKIKYVCGRLVTEFRVMHKPGPKELAIDSARVTATAFVAAVVLKLVDTGFSALLSLIM